MINVMERYFSFLVRRRILIFTIISLLLLVTMVVLSNHLEKNPNPAMYSIYFLVSSIIINLVAASLWYSLLVTNQKLQKSEPLLKAFPFLKDKSSKLYIIFATVPSITGHETTGIGEARGLGVILENLHSINFPSENIYVNYSSRYSDDEMKEILQKQHVILLGGPNFNKFTRTVIDKNHERLAYLFKEDSKKTEVVKSNNAITKINKKYSGIIVNNTIRQELITCPKPLNVMEDASVTKDCGIIVRFISDYNKTITLLAGSMTSGVWASTKLMTEFDLIEKWIKRLRTHNEESEFEIVFESDVKNILSVESEDIAIIKITKLVS